MSEVTRILKAIDQGSVQATSELLPLIYDELRHLAAQKLSQEKPGQTLQSTALVHEAYLRLVGTEDQRWDNRGHFFSAAAEAMRRILVDNARRKKTLKQGGQFVRHDLDESIVDPSAAPDDVIEVDEALNRLAASDATSAELVKLRYFAGFTVKEAAEILGISSRTADSLWAYARAWLLEEIEQD